MTSISCSPASLIISCRDHFKARTIIRSIQKIDWTWAKRQYELITLLSVLAFLSLFNVGDLWAANVNAASCSSTNVQTAINSANDGDTVFVPAGTCTWTASVQIANKSISLIGTGIGKTIIDGQDASTYGRGSALDWTTKNTGNGPPGFSRLSGFTWRGTAGAQGYAGGTILSFRGYSQNVRIDNNRIEITRTGGIQTWDGVNGVLDHNQLVNLSATLAHILQFTHCNWLVTETTCNGDTSWSSDATFGQPANWYIENNEITNSLGTLGWYCSDDHGGSRAVYRFNLITNCSLQLHGTETSGRLRGGRYLETYRNTFTYTLGDNFPSVIANRGGGGRHWDNTATGSLQRIADLSTLRANDTYDPNGHAGSYPYGRCGRVPILSITRSGSTATATLNAGPTGHYSNPGGSYQTIAGANQPEFNGTFVTYPASTTTITYTLTSIPTATTATGPITMTSPFDGNTDSTGYRCLDQAGAGKTINYTGNGPAFAPTIGPIANSNAALEPILVWGNRLNGSQADIALLGVPGVLANRDVYNENANCSGSSCTGGIGRGTSLPTGCTPTATSSGPYFWITDEGTWNAPGADGPQDGADADGVLYQCTATNTWALFYTPFPYPHPLLSGSTASNPPPASPTGLKVQ